MRLHSGPLVNVPAVLEKVDKVFTAVCVHVLPTYPLVNLWTLEVNQVVDKFFAVILSDFMLKKRRHVLVGKLFRSYVASLGELFKRHVATRISALLATDTCSL